MLTLPNTFYLVVTDFKTQGVSNAGDMTDSHDAAYDQYAEAVGDGQATRVLLLEMDVETNLPETFSDVTSQFAAEYAMICEARGIEIAAE